MVSHRNLICQKLKLKGKISVTRGVVKKIKVYIERYYAIKKILGCTDKKGDKYLLCIGCYL